MSAPEIAGEQARPAPSRARRARTHFDLRRHGLRVAVIFGGLLLLNVAFWLALVRPRQVEIARLSEAKARADVTEKAAAKALEARRTVQAHVQGVQTGVQRFYEDLLSTKERRMVPFQRALAQVGREFNVEPERVAYSMKDLTAEGIEAVGFSFPLTGGYENLRRFLARLEELEQLLIVRQVSLAGGDEGGRMLQLNVNVETYFNAPGLREREKEVPKKDWRTKSRGSRRAGGTRR
ncbi:MAG: hypothetical protein KBD01_17960 [Acidobacteria bacterium]|nr:hypothetical protein [Acidobacteriota bacterium]